jgi:hypothetical protein
VSAAGGKQRKSRFFAPKGHGGQVQSLAISVACAENSLLSGTMGFQWNFFADQRIKAALSTEKQSNTANLVTCQQRAAPEHVAPGGVAPTRLAALGILSRTAGEGGPGPKGRVGEGGTDSVDPHRPGDFVGLLLAGGSARTSIRAAMLMPPP